MKRVIFFATYIPNQQSIEYTKNVLDKLLEYGFSDSDLFVGINPTTNELENLWVEELKRISIKFNSLSYGITEKELVVNSDVSAFQTALNLYKKSNLKHDVCWFAHAKGVTSGSKFLSEVYKCFFSKKNEIENIFKENDEIGFFSAYPYYIQGEKWKDFVENNLKHILVGDKYGKCDNLSCHYTFYVLKGDVIYNFVNDVESFFFEKNILSMGNSSEQNYDRYFFERDFPMIFQKYKYKPYCTDYSWLEKYR